MSEATGISQSRIFDGLSTDERRLWIEGGTPRSLKRGQALARQGDEARTFYVVERGLLKLVQLTPEGHELIVRFVGPGEPFGGVVALDGATYPVTALAVESTDVRGWLKGALGRLLERFPQVRTNIMREMTSHMTDALTRVRELTTERVGQRLAHTLLRLMRQCGKTTDEGVLITHPLTRQELAELTGTTLYTVSRTLSQWQAEGILHSTKRRLLVREPDRLEQIAEAPEP